MSSTMIPVAQPGHVPVTTERLSVTQEFTPGVRSTIIAAIVFGALLLASIGGWLWWGMHQYQNILPLVKGTF
jgi:hypothetical protein